MALGSSGRANGARAADRHIATVQEWIAENYAHAAPVAAITFKDCGIPDVICVPDLQVAPGESIAGRFDDAMAWLTQCHQAGATLASACSGTLLLAEAGLLDGCEATTHWAYCEDLSRSYPRIAVRQARCLVVAGDGQRIITSGGGTSYLDLGLFVIARFFGQEEAVRVARVF
jgi:transcriptional regulator GlxA family with amidase domain